MTAETPTFELPQRLDERGYALVLAEHHYDLDQELQVTRHLIEHGVDITNKDHMPGVKRLLNSNEYRYLKVRNIII